VPTRVFVPIVVVNAGWRDPFRFSITFETMLVDVDDVVVVAGSSSLPARHWFLLFLRCLPFLLLLGRSTHGSFQRRRTNGIRITCAAAFTHRAYTRCVFRTRSNSQNARTQRSTFGRNAFDKRWFRTTDGDSVGTTILFQLFDGPLSNVGRRRWHVNPVCKGKEVLFLLFEKWSAVIA
jgi:hypothetical protein